MFTYITRLALLFTAFLGAASVQAMWVRMTDAELVERSHLIVTAIYIGNADIRLKADAEVLHLGVLDIDSTLKGPQRKVILLQLPRSQGQLRKSDDISFHPGQKGLWFLREDGQNKGLYVIDNPQRFVPQEKVAGRMESLLKLLAR